MKAISAAELDRFAGPRDLAVVDAITEAVRSGRLSAGDRLPPQRTLACELGLSVNTVMRAHVEAERLRAALETSSGVLREGSVSAPGTPAPGSR